MVNNYNLDLSCSKCCTGDEDHYISYKDELYCSECYKEIKEKEEKEKFEYSMWHYFSKH